MRCAARESMATRTSGGSGGGVSATEGCVWMCVRVDRGEAMCRSEWGLLSGESESAVGWTTRER